MLPLPDRLTPINRTLRSDHRLLAPGDRCTFFGELTAGTHSYHDPIKDLITNFKITPTELTAMPGRCNWKQWATRIIGEALAQQLASTPCGYFVVPIPPSKIPGHPDYDDRMLRALAIAQARLLARAHQHLTVRELLKQRTSTPADHETTHRQSYDQLLRNTYLVERVARPSPTGIILVDDVLTDGKHFKVAQRLIRQHYGPIPVLGLFIARRAPRSENLSHPPAPP